MPKNNQPIESLPHARLVRLIRERDATIQSLRATVDYHKKKAAEYKAQIEGMKK